MRDVKDGTIAASWALAESLLTVDWHPDGRWLAVGGELGTIRLLDASDVSCPGKTIHAHDGAVVAVAFHPGGRLLASASWDGTMRLWDIESAEQLVRCPMPEVHPLRFSLDGQFLGPALDGAAAWSWEVAPGDECRSLPGADGVGQMTWSADFLAATGVLASAVDTGVRLEVPGGGAKGFVELPGTAGLATARDGSFLITSGSTGLLRWPVGRVAAGDLRVGPPEPVGPLAGMPTVRVRLGRDGRTLAAVVDAEVGRVAIVDLRGGSPLVTLPAHPNLNRLDLSPDGRWLATGTWHGNGVRVWDVRSVTLVREIDVESSAEVRFSPDGRSLVTASGDEYAMWDVGSWTRRWQVPRSHATGLPGQVAFSPSGGVLAITKTRTQVQLVDAESGRDLATLEAPGPKNISALEFSADGRLLAVALERAGVQVWDLGAICRGLESLGLDCLGATGAGPVTTPIFTPKHIVVEGAPWMAPLVRGEELARLARWDDAAAAFELASASGARHLDAQARRVLYRAARGDEKGYREACRQLVRMFEGSALVPRDATDIARACALGSRAVEDFSRVVHLAEIAVASRATTARLSTLGAILYRAGRYEEALRELGRAVEVQGAHGTPFGALLPGHGPSPARACRPGAALAAARIGGRSRRHANARCARRHVVDPAARA